MNLLQTQQRINELMSIFVHQIKGATAMGHTDINRVAETILIPLFAEIFGYKHLRNLNSGAGHNYPAIDLGDEVARVAFQITSTPGLEKTKDALAKFVEYKLYETYDRLVIYVLTEKQRSYSGSACDEIVQGKFAFDVEKDVWDYRDVLNAVSVLQIDRARRIQQILEANFADGAMPLLQEQGEPTTETLSLNLLEIFFPETLYVADLDLDVVIPSRRARSRRTKRKPSSERKLVQSALKRLDLKFAVDWECHELKLVTFRDLTDDTLPLSAIVDKGTITPISPQEYYGQGEDFENVFKSLLRRCLQQKLYHQQVQWQNEDHLFIFSEVDGQPVRKETWRGKMEVERTVYDRTMKNNKPNEILYCKHFGFRVQFKRIVSQWYVLIIPDWFFSYDGYKRSFYCEDKIDWLKRNENNQHILNHVRFVAYFLGYDKPSDLFKTRVPYPFLSFGDLVSLDGAPSLNDEEWNPPKPKETEGVAEDSDQRQLSLDL